MRRHRKRSAGLLADAALGLVSGLVASWIMEQAQTRIQALGSEATRAREKRARGDLEPATVRVAEAAAEALHRALPRDKKEAAGELVHYATGAAFGALFGAFARRWPARVVLAGTVFGGIVWLLNDETLVPALGFSRMPWDYPVSTHAKALAAHLVYGAATGAGYRVLHAGVG